MPRVSVLTPIYNTNPAHLRECIESILNQTFTDFEFLILNDSPDNLDLDRLVESYAKRDSRIRYMKNEKNMGISAARNKLLDLAHGEYLAIFDHDDISVPTRLEQQVAYLDAHPDVGVVSGLLESFGVKNYVWSAPENDIDIRMFLTNNCSIAHTAAMIRKSVLVDNDIKYEEFYSPAEDYRLWARLMDVTHFYNIQQVLVKYRTHNNMTTLQQEQKMNLAWRAISTQLRNQYPAYYNALKKCPHANVTFFRLRLFGIIPILKIENNWVLLFDLIPIFKLKWR